MWKSGQFNLDLYTVTVLALSLTRDVMASAAKAVTMKKRTISENAVL